MLKHQVLHTFFAVALVLLPGLAGAAEPYPSRPVRIVIPSGAGYEARGWNGILAPAGTSKPLIERLHKEIVLVVHSPDFLKQLATEGAVPIGNTPSEFATVVQADLAKWAKVIKDAGIRPE